MKKQYRVFMIGLFSLLIFGSWDNVTAAVEDSASVKSSSSMDSSTTKMNVRDSDKIKPRITADDQQRGDSSDDELTRQIRRRITEDKNFSESARNITIITIGQNMTLKGEVKNKREKNKVLSIVHDLADDKTIFDHITYQAKN
ncbi:MAG: BON domain-containing protein [Oligoflexia bacterium]|nr:BON domain-containing protein [Oligoflexia bacterium]